MPRSLDMVLLEKMPFLRSLSETQRTALTDLTTYSTFPENHLICREGTIGEAMYFIESGEVLSYTHDAGGARKEFRALGPGEFFGEVALLSGGTRSSNVVAIREVSVYALHHENLNAFLQVHPDIPLSMLKEMAERLQTSGQMLRDTRTPRIAEEIALDRTGAEKRVQTAVQRIGGLSFLFFNLTACGVWMGANRLLARPLDSREFGFLALFLGVEGFVMTVLVLAKQNRDEKDSDIRTNRILTNTYTTDQQIQQLSEKVEALSQELREERQAGSRP
ncbi:MAG: cyclic nucleotide-binding domain-containing protein [Cytophagales bacterium]|nr:cyclic nucleotide-binding domain-containing protein [Armatimonadota bacterium]